VDLASPATPEAVFWAIEAARRPVRPSDEGDGGVSGGGAADGDGGERADASGLGTAADAERPLVPFDR
jgi:xanthine dehydrogenase large subunit